MSKIVQTAQQRANTLEALNVMWPSIRPVEVTKKLEGWRCGSTACFGGWCAVWPKFQAQGLSPGAEGIPMLDGAINVDADDVLFGDRNLFNSRDCHPADEDCDDETDHELVTHRLQWLLENSEVKP